MPSVITRNLDSKPAEVRDAGRTAFSSSRSFVLRRVPSWTSGRIVAILDVHRFNEF